MTDKAANRKRKSKVTEPDEQPDEEQPEEVVADSVQIQRLKDLYERTLSSTAGKLKKKKRTALVVEATEEIDVHTLEAALAAGQKDQEADKTEELANTAECEKESKKRKTVKTM
ncbi:hypothetical protein EON65_34205 [archaeon]|nr:MAG: hypothetical protein EON65_34205 [archaeon]